MVRSPEAATSRFLKSIWLVGIALVTGCQIDEGDRTAGAPLLKVSENRLEFLVTRDGDSLTAELELQSNAGALVEWVITTDTPWIFTDPIEGQTSTELDTIGVGVVPDQLAPGVHRGSVTIREITETAVREQSVDVTVRVCETTCIFANTTRPAHKVSSLLFGSQSEYVNSGSAIWDSAVTSDCNDPAIPLPGRPHLEMLNEFSNLGINLIRYPSGIPSDFFNWKEAIGPVSGRVPQINPWNSTHTDLQRECPVFGPDEFVQYANLLDASMLITTNVGTGTAQDAADWLDYYRTNGVAAEYWEVGNEIYIEGEDYLFSVFMQPHEYAAAYDEHAKALRRVDPDVKVGVVMSPMDQDWNRGVMEALTEPFDFVSLHSFQPQTDTCNEPSDAEVYKSLLASPLLIDVQKEFIKEAAIEHALVPADAPPIFSVSEWGAWFLHACDPGSTVDNDARARTLASALFSGVVFNDLIRDPSIFSAVHSSLASLNAQAVLNLVFDSVEGWIPIRSAHYFVHDLYAESAGGTVIPTAIHSSPVFTAKLFDDAAERVELPVLDSISVMSEDNSNIYIYIVNRSLDEDIDFQLLIGDLPRAVTSIESDTLAADSFSAANTIDRPDAVGIVNTVLATTEDLRLTLKAHSLVRITLSLATD